MHETRPRAFELQLVRVPVRLYNRLDICIVHVLSFPEVVCIVNNVAAVFMEECNLCECEAPIKVIGDIHAQYQDMNRLFDLIGRVPQERFLFLGDYVDRGPQGLEVVILLFALKLRYRDRIYLLRGNHETPAVNKIYGFYNECVMKYGAGIWWDFQACFNRIPLAGLISKRVLCMHGGLSPELSHLDVIRNIPRPCEPLDRGLLIDLTWSDPTNKGEGWFHSIRGISYMFGKGVVQQACQMLGIDLVIRAHQISFQQLKMQIPANLAPKAKPAPAIACDTNPSNAKADKDFIKPFTGFKGKSVPSDEKEKSPSNTSTGTDAPSTSAAPATTGADATGAKEAPPASDAGGTKAEPAPAGTTADSSKATDPEKKIEEEKSVTKPPSENPAGS
ncbi:phosphoprotein phosphatase 1 domain protein [Ancylostoma ceylanicum]|uniref:Serine/threonine-protein phosphatase n=1 Tax=Ancylostoma ceylanicum TaxID=53326 RepID=A0A0D6M2K9_9BILA|nr:phosphoprotein phosphatase 1 domain protein [Ancylostoma ceylanicum]